MHAQDDMLGFDLDLAVEGDVTLAFWRGDHKSQWEAPAFAYAFHTSLTEAGVLRATSAELDFPGSREPLGADAGCFMDIMLREGAAPKDGMNIK